ncbi:ribonuclease HII, partial [Flavobacteriaceae bacterium]|nr:ribonuclease HII [Flavobacteriaceae bacterium]
SLFTTTNSKGDLIQVNTKGAVSRQSLGLDLKHNITCSSKTLVTRSDNKLSIKSNTLDLDFGSYTSPILFYLRDKIYISITDLQAQKIWLFDSQAKPLASVPVFGSSAIDLANADADVLLEFVTKSDANSLIMYQLY